MTDPIPLCHCNTVNKVSWSITFVVYRVIPNESTIFIAIKHVNSKLISQCNQFIIRHIISNWLVGRNHRDLLSSGKVFIQYSMITTKIPPVNMPYLLNLRFVTWFCLSSETEPSKLITILTDKYFDCLLVDIVSSEPSHVVCYHTTRIPVYSCPKGLYLLIKYFFVWEILKPMI